MPAPAVDRGALGAGEDPAPSESKDSVSSVRGVRGRTADSLRRAQVCYFGHGALQLLCKGGIRAMLLLLKGLELLTERTQLRQQ